MSAAPANPSGGAVFASLAAFGRRTSSNQPAAPPHPPSQDASFQFPSRAQSVAGAAPGSQSASRRSTLDDISEQHHGDGGRGVARLPSNAGASRLANGSIGGWPASLGGGRGPEALEPATAGGAVELTRTLLSRCAIVCVGVLKKGRTRRAPCLDWPRSILPSLFDCRHVSGLFFLRQCRFTTDTTVDASHLTRIASGGGRGSGGCGYELPASVFTRLAAASSGGGESSPLCITQTIPPAYASLSLCLSANEPPSLCILTCLATDN